MQPVLQLTNVSVSFETPYGEVEAVRDVSWSLNPGEVLAIVGESGCGKNSNGSIYYEVASKEF